MQVVGVTGTNGKTTFTYLMEAITSRVKKTGVIGTINYRYGGKIFPAPNTTPFAGDLASLLANMKARGVKTVVMEVSSHSLSQRRVDGVEFDCAVFTNLTQDHLDYHGDMQSYFEAKRRLFTELMYKSPKKNKTCVIDVDDEWGKKLAQSVGSINGGARLITCSVCGPADARVTDFQMSPRGASFSCDISGSKLKFETRLIGKYNISNAFLASVAALSCGFSPSDVKKGLLSLKCIPGRLETIHARKGFTVVIDYAHTPDALSKVIDTLRDLKGGRLITVFGCGGDRDRTKRPVMGAAAVGGSDMVVVTSDNPRMEDPHKIILDIEIGIKKTGASNYSIIMDRKEAIGYAVGAARPQDIVLIAGKGHETYQIIGEEKIPFSDYEAAAEAIKNRV
jgi:UDP-N-acetylmuramoyl-L-alanyl-D-glutamate--2,6-diaminopimelate ligase